VWVLADDECDFLGAGPAFELLLAGQGFVHFVVRFPIEQADDLVAVCESFEVVELVLEDAAVKIAGDADVESAGEAAHDVGAIVLAVAGHGILSEDLRGLATAILAKLRCFPWMGMW
jgi:hypothetical protein